MRSTAATWTHRCRTWRTQLEGLPEAFSPATHHERTQRPTGLGREIRLDDRSRAGLTGGRNVPDTCVDAVHGQSGGVRCVLPSTWGAGRSRRGRARLGALDAEADPARRLFLQHSSDSLVLVGKPDVRRTGRANAADGDRGVDESGRAVRASAPDAATAGWSLLRRRVSMPELSTIESGGRRPCHSRIRRSTGDSRQWDLLVEMTPRGARGPRFASRTSAMRTEPYSGRKDGRMRSRGLWSGPRRGQASFRPRRPIDGAATIRRMIADFLRAVSSSRLRMPALEFAGRAGVPTESSHHRLHRSHRRSRCPPSTIASLTAVLAERSISAYAGFVATQLAGHTFVPLNPGFPARALARMQRIAGARICVSAGREGHQRPH